MTASAPSTKTLATCATFLAALLVADAALADRLVCNRSCKVRLAVVDGKPVVQDDPIVVERGHRNVHINWVAPQGWEFVDGGARLKRAASGFDQWCATDSDDDACTSRRERGRQYHCRNANATAGAHEYLLRLRNTSTGQISEIDPVIINKGS